MSTQMPDQELQFAIFHCKSMAGDTKFNFDTM